MNGQPPNVNRNHATDATAWYLLVDFSAREFLSDQDRSDGLMTGFLSSPLRELDTLPGWVADLEAMLARFAKEVIGHFERGGRVRLFCQRKIVDEEHFERATLQFDPAEQAIRDSGEKMNGGWGCYAIEKGRDFTEAACTEPCYIIDIYIYRESIDTP